MRIARTSIALIAMVMAAVSAPALAGNSAQSDPRSTTAASAQPRTEAAQKTRAEVHAEAVAWAASGMSQMAYGEVGFDSMGPSYERAQQAFERLRSDAARTAAGGR